MLTLMDCCQVFVVQSPALRGQAVLSDSVCHSESPDRSDLQAGAFAGSSIELAAVESPVVLKARRASGTKASNGSRSRRLRGEALPEPRPNDAMLPAALGLFGMPASSCLRLLGCLHFLHGRLSSTGDESELWLLAGSC